MGKLWMQAFANIRKTKSVSITLSALFLIATLLLNTGLLVTINYGSFFDELKKELNTSDAYFLVPEILYNDDAKDYLKNNEHITKTEESSVLMVSADINYQDDNRSFTVMFNDMEKDRELSKWKLHNGYESAEEMSVYIPDIFNAVGGYEIGDNIKLSYKDITTGDKKDIDFTVKGFTEDIFFSSIDTVMMGFYVTSDTYEKISKTFNDVQYKANVIFTNVDEINNVSKIDNGIRETLNLNSSSLMSGDTSSLIMALDIDLIELSRCMMASMMATMMVMFSVVIVIVCLLVVRFRIVNSLDDDILKIGSLKSIGYTNRQLRASLLMQFLSIAGVGSILGIFLSYPLIPYISVVFEQQSGLKWIQGFDPIISGVALIVLLLIVVLISLLASRNIKNLTPVLALRGKTTTKKYTTNRLPIEQSKGSLPVALAFKSIFQNIKQTIMITVILIAVAFEGVFGVVMYYNTTYDTSAFAKVPGFEITDVILALNTDKDHAQVIETINNMSEVSKTQYVDEVKVKIDDLQAGCILMNDFSTRETNLIYEGRYPESSGEVSIAGILSERINKKIGETVTIQYGNTKKDFKITGLSNGSSMGGINCTLITSDFQELNTEFKQQLLYVYLNKGNDVEEFIEKIDNTFSKDIVLATSNFNKLLAEGMASYQNIVAIMGIVMLIITLFIIILVLYFVISSSIIRSKKELGIQKAIGFTTKQLMHQLAITFTVPILFGCVVGTVLGAVLTNPLMSIAMKSMGIMKSCFIVDKLWISIFGISIIAFSYLLSLLITWRIRKISAYNLVTE